MLYHGNIGLECTISLEYYTHVTPIRRKLYFLRLAVLESSGEIALRRPRAVIESSVEWLPPLPADLPLLEGEGVLESGRSGVVNGVLFAPRLDAEL